MHRRETTTTRASEREDSNYLLLGVNNHILSYEFGKSTQEQLHLMSVETKSSAAESATISKEEFMCPLCQCLLFEPVTTPCGMPSNILRSHRCFAIWLIIRFFFLVGHTYCRECILRLVIMHHVFIKPNY